MAAGRATILTWHSVSEDRPPLCVSPQRLERQLDALARAGLEAVPLSALVERIEARRPLPGRWLALTFDDGYSDFETHALPVLERRGLPATLFVTAARQRLPGGLDASLLPLEALAGLAGRGVEIGAHSVGHGDLTALGEAALDAELRECRRVLEAHAGCAVEHFAYPFGRFDARVRRAVARVFRSASTTRLERVREGADPYALPRVDAHYLRSPALRWLLAADAPDAYLRLRQGLRRLRGSEPAATVAAGTLVPLGGLPPCP